MSLDDDFLDEKQKRIECELTRDIKESDQLFIIGKRIFLQPTVERTESGFRLYGTPTDIMLPYFTVEIDFDAKKVMTVIKGEDIPSKYRTQIERIVCENF